MKPTVTSELAKRARASVKSYARATATVAGAGLMALSPTSLGDHYFAGEKFPGGLTESYFDELDYEELREHSKTAFYTNPYGRGIIRRMITNEINVGLHLECEPVYSILDNKEEELDTWAEEAEEHFNLWSKTPGLCDIRGVNTFGSVQRSVRRTSLVEGDCVVVLRNVKGRLKVQLIPGCSIIQPYNFKEGVDVVDGVEVDSTGSHVAYYVAQKKGPPKRLAAFGSRTGRRVAWMVYGLEQMEGKRRGEPLLSIILQSLSEIDKYRDSAQRKAVINSMLAMFIQKDVDKPGTLPLGNGAKRKGTTPDADVKTVDRSYKATGMMPGMVIDELQVGETPQSFGGQGTDVNFGVFEEAVMSALAWQLEIPPEILKLSFSSNYSASTAAVNEYNMYLNKVREWLGSTVCAPIYQEWLITEDISGRFRTTNLLKYYEDRNEDYKYHALTYSDWAGAVKPSTDLKKLMQGVRPAIDRGILTNARATREITGMKWSRNVRKMKKENAQLLEAKRPMIEAMMELEGKSKEAMEVDFDSTDRADNDELMDAVHDAVITAMEEGKEDE